MEIFNIRTSVRGFYLLESKTCALVPPDDIKNAMEQQIKAERDRRSIVLKADGERESTIINSRGNAARVVLNAEGERASQILKAKGEAEAKMLAARAEAQSIQAIRAGALSFRGSVWHGGLMCYDKSNRGKKCSSSGLFGWNAVLRCIETYDRQRPPVRDHFGSNRYVLRH